MRWTEEDVWGEGVTGAWWAPRGRSRKWGGGARRCRRARSAVVVSVASATAVVQNQSTGLCALVGQKLAIPHCASNGVRIMRFSMQPPQLYSTAPRHNGRVVWPPACPAATASFRRPIPPNGYRSKDVQQTKNPAACTRRASPSLAIATVVVVNAARFLSRVCRFARRPPAGTRRRASNRLCTLGSPHHPTRCMPLRFFLNTE